MIRGIKETENVTVVSKVVGMISAGCFGLQGGRFIVTMAVTLNDIYVDWYGL